MKAVRYLVNALAIMSLLFVSLAMAPAAPSNGLHLKSGDFVVGDSSAAAQPSQKYFIVQFAGPVQQSWKDAVEAEGAVILDYIPDFAFKVSMNPATANRVAGQGFVSNVIAFQPEFKFSVDLIRDSEMRLYRVRIERGADFGLVRSLVARTGAEVLSFDGNMLVVAAYDSFVNAIAQVDDVASIANFNLNQTFSTETAPSKNDYATENIIGASDAWARGYNGSTQTVAVADTGLGGGTPSTAHRDINGRVTSIYNWPGVNDKCWSISDDGAVDIDSGHGTHTSGSVLSSGGPGGEGTGAAPAAHLVFQATENWANMKGLCAIYYDSGYYLTGLPTDLATLFQQAYDDGARVHSNSWGSPVAGDYTADSASADAFVNSHPDMVITFSAGNEGIDANADGIIDDDSIGSPGTAKNVITVGASENQRNDAYPCDNSLNYIINGSSCQSLGGQNHIFTYGEAWSADYPANPIFSDSSANSAQQMAAFSSRGPTDDGRIKPDVVAPGTWILSTYSDLYQEGYDASPNPKNGAYQYDGYGFPYDSYYKYLSGTSMSNPLTAGGAAVVKDYYLKAHGINASAALVKATIINSAVDLLDENNDGANDNDFPIPNNYEGWGLINLNGATDGSLQYVEEGAGLATGANATFTATTTGGPLKVTIVWSDAPSTDTASINLVNDLDLTVSGPSGTFKGNVFSGGWSQTGGSADRRNNVENVYIAAPSAGTYTITINGYNVPNGPQTFALVVDGANVTAPPPPAGAHVGDIDGSNQTVNSKNWRAVVTVTVHDASHQPVAKATVSGNWSGGLTGSGSCVTNGSGVCTITNANISTRKANAIFTVGDITASGFTYQGSSNHDPESDSNGTAITISKP